MGDGKGVRLTVNLGPQAVGALYSAQAREGGNATSVVNRALVLYDEYTRETERGHKHLLERDGEQYEVTYNWVIPQAKNTPEG